MADEKLHLRVVSDGTRWGTYVCDQDGRRVVDCVRVEFTFDPEGESRTKLEFLRLPVDLGVKPDDPNTTVTEIRYEWARPLSELIRANLR